MYSRGQSPVGARVWSPFVLRSTWLGGARVAGCGGLPALAGLPHSPEVSRADMCHTCDVVSSQPEDTPTSCLPTGNVLISAENILRITNYLKNAMLLGYLKHVGGGPCSQGSGEVPWL